MKKTSYILPVTVILALLIISGCSKKRDTGSPQTNVKQISKVETDTAKELEGQLDPIANPNAEKGGTFVTWGSSFPKSLNMWLDYNSFSVEVTGLMFEPLAELHSTKNEAVGVLAESWTISDDQKVFTFKLHPQAQWSDGKPVTAEDIQFHYDVIVDKNNLTSLFRVSLQRFERPEIIDEKTIRMSAKESHWSNFWTVAGLTAFPKHIWKDVDFNKQNFEFPVVNGPYQLKTLKKNRYLELQRREDWWGRTKEYNHYKCNFDFIRYKFMEDQNKILEAFKGGVFDAIALYTSSIWMKQTDFDAVKKGWVVKQRIFNKEPKGFQGFVFNLRRPLFEDVKLREALCHLMNRESMNEKLMYNQYFLLNSYFPDLYTNNINPDVPLRKYDPEKARALLSSAGWKVGPDGWQTKDGKQLQISFISHSPDQRHLNIFIEDLKSVGIQATIEQLSYSTYRKRMDNHDFDMTWIAWGAVRLRDPEASWHSSTADQIATNNAPGLKDPIIDSLIEAQKTEMSLDVRNEILKQIDKRLNEIIPYILLWQSDNTRLLYWNKFGTPSCVLDKYNREDCIAKYWWIDTKKEKSLSEMMEKNQSQEPVIGDVHYEE